MRVRDSNSNNVGNLLIGQTVTVKVTDAAGQSSFREMEVGEIYPAGEILLKDVESGNTIVLQFNEEASAQLPNGLVYQNLNQDNGITHELVISSELMSNESITRQVLSESLISKNYMNRIIKINQ